METTKLKVRVGQHEFEAEGPAEQVTAQYNAWRELIVAMPQAPAATASQGDRPAPSIPASAVTEVKTREGYSAPWDIFGSDSDKDLMTLKVHPPAGDNQDSDAILLVMYGYRKAGNDGDGLAEVPVTKLKESLDVSGLRIPRIDRAAARYIKAGYLLKTGRAKGGIYRLTNTGYARAEELAQRIFAQLV